MPEFYFTWGYGQGHDRCYTIIEAETEIKAREEMTLRWGPKWGFVYSSAEEAGVEDFDLKYIETLPCSPPCIGLFGTCANSSWREAFKVVYDKLGIKYYDPQVEDWTPECAVEEAEHLAKDDIILFPVLSESYGMGSLAEVGFSILQAIRIDSQRDFVILVDSDLDDNLTDEAARKASLGARRLVLSHLSKLAMKNVYLANTMDEMLAISVQLHEAARLKKQVEKYNLRG